MNKKDFFNGCFPANWVEVDTKKETKEEVLIREETQQRKDVATLLAELEEIKNGYEQIQEKQVILKNMMKFYKGELAT